MQGRLKLAGYLFFSLLPVFSASANDLSLTVVYDNNPYREGLETRWGFSCLVEGLEKTILFDLGGEWPVIARNMHKLGIDPQSIDAVSLSHVHQDHIGGLSGFLEINPLVTVYIPKSFPQNIRYTIKRSGADFVEVHGLVRICQHAYSTGELGSSIQEQSLVLETAAGLVIVTGCAHPGILEIIRNAKQMMHDDVYLVLGGFHLGSLNAQQLRRLVLDFRSEKVQKVAPCHCSADPARRQFAESYREDYIPAGAGFMLTVVEAF